MTELIHLNCGTLLVPTYPTVVCHCLALREGDRVVLVDAGIGMLDVRNPAGRLGQELIDAAGFQFNEHDTAIARLASIGVPPEQVSDIVLTHADPDHAGGLGDFPSARVHITQQELDELGSDNPRYVQAHFAHAPRWIGHNLTQNGEDWFGLPALRLDLPLTAQVYLIGLPGHTHGHCGVAIQQHDSWFLHVGDAYYLRAEIAEPDHPVSGLASARADDDTGRRRSLEHLRRLSTDHAEQISMCGYHDISELPAHCIDWD